MDRRNFLGNIGLSAAFASLRPDAITRIISAGEPLKNASPEDVATDEDFWFQVQQAFTVDRNQINLNSGSVSPSPRVVQEAMRQYLTIFNMSPSLWVDELLYPQHEVVREGLAGMFGCDPEELAVTRNTSESLQIIQFGMPLSKGDEILITSQDYPRMLTTWEQRVRRDGVVLKPFPVPTPADSPDQLFKLFEDNITPRTRVIHFSHITYTAGQIFPVKRICQMARARGIETIVDGAHAFAHFPFTIDDLGCDYYGTSLHKWLTAPLGTGFLYVRREKIRTIWPLMAAPPSLDDNIRKFEQIGTHPISNRNSITEAITFNESIGIDRKAARLRYLKDRWMDRVTDLPGVDILTPRSPELSCAIGTMKIEGIGAAELVAHLLSTYRIHTRARFVPGEWEGVRVTPNVFTTLKEVDTFAEAIETIVKNGI